jgi:hypothetical protein
MLVGCWHRCLFDILTVVRLIVMVMVLLLFTERRPRTLLHLLLSGIAFAIADQVGNPGWIVLGLIVVGAGVWCAAIAIQIDLVAISCPTYYGRLIVLPRKCLRGVVRLVRA